MNYKLKVTIPVVVCGGAVLAYYLIRRFVEKLHNCFKIFILTDYEFYNYPHKYFQFS